MVLFEYSAQGATGGAFRHPAEGVDRVGTILGSGAMVERRSRMRSSSHATGDAGSGVDRVSGRFP